MQARAEYVPIYMCPCIYYIYIDMHISIHVHTAENLPVAEAADCGLIELGAPAPAGRGRLPRCIYIKARRFQ